MLGGSLVSTDGKVIGSNEFIKLGYNYSIVLGNILWNVNRITLGIGVGIDMLSLDGSLYGYNYVKIEVLLLVN